MKCLVTGGSGFLGSYVADELSNNGHEVIIFDKKKSQWLKTNQSMVVGDINNLAKIKTVIKKCDLVFHFAGLSDLNEALNKPLESATYNILGTVNLLKLCEKYKIKRFIYASSIYVLSEQGGFYRVSKKASEEYIEEFSKRFNLNFTILRYGTIYGRRANNENGVRKIIHNAVKNKRIVYVGTSNSERKYISARDAAKITIRTIKNTYKNKHVNILGAKKIKVKKFLAKVKKILNIKSNMKFKNKKIVGHYVSNPSNFKIKKGINITASSYKNFDNDIKEIIQEIRKK
jgi:UDP-glucose 4-epimerase